MSTASVAGVDVDTRHWIGGRRVASVSVGARVSVGTGQMHLWFDKPAGGWGGTDA